MPKLPVVAPKRFVKLLLKLGFRYSHANGSHQYYIDTNKRIVCVAMHNRDIPKGTLLAMVKDIGLTKEGFISLLREA